MGLSALRRVCRASRELLCPDLLSHARQYVRIVRAQMPAGTMRDLATVDRAAARPRAACAATSFFAASAASFSAAAFSAAAFSAAAFLAASIACLATLTLTTLTPVEGT